MKKIYLLMLASAMMFAGCSKSDGGAEPGTGTEPGLPTELPDGGFVFQTSNVHAANFTLNVTANAEVGNYYVVVAAASIVKAEFDSDKEKLIKALLAQDVTIGTDFSKADGLYIFNGTANYDVFESWLLVAGEKQLIYAFGISAKGEITTKIAEGEIMLPATETGVSITLSVSGQSDTGAIISNKISDPHVPYFSGCVEADGFAEMSDAEIVAMVMAAYGSALEVPAAVGDIENDLTDELTSGTKYYAFAFGYASDAEGNLIATTKVFKQAFETTGTAPAPDPGAPESVVIPNVNFGTVALGNAKDSSLDLTVTPADKEMTYICLLMTKSNYLKFATPEALILDDLSYIADEAALYGDTYLENLTGYYLDKGNSTGTIGELDPGVTYVAYAYGMSANGQDVLSKMVTAELATTGTAAAQKVKLFGHSSLKKASGVSGAKSMHKMSRPADLRPAHKYSRAVLPHAMR